MEMLSNRWMNFGTIKHTIKLHCLEKMTNLPGFLSKVDPTLSQQALKLMQFVYFDSKTNDWHQYF